MVTLKEIDNLIYKNMSKYTVSELVDFIITQIPYEKRLKETIKKIIETRVYRVFDHLKNN